MQMSELAGYLGGVWTPPSEGTLSEDEASERAAPSESARGTAGSRGEGGSGVGWTAQRARREVVAPRATELQRVRAVASFERIGGSPGGGVESGDLGGAARAGVV